MDAPATLFFGSLQEDRLNDAPRERLSFSSFDDAIRHALETMPGRREPS
jgi:hypothetical protein